MSRTNRRKQAFQEVRCGPAAAGGNASAPRDARMPQFVGLRAAPVEAMARLRAMVVGAGSVGGEIVQHLARLRVKELWIVEPGRFKGASLLTHGIPPAAVGRSKARYWGRLCKSISPGTRVRVFDGPVQALPLAALGRVDVALVATDNLAAEVEVGQRCMRQQVPLLQASLHGDSLVSQVRYWSNAGAGGSCPCCAFSDREWAHVSRETVFRCSGPEGRPVEEGNVAPTMSVSFLCSMAADMAMMQLLRLVLRLGPRLSDSVTEYCGFNHRTTVSPLVRNRQCRAEHAAWRAVGVEGPLGAWSLRRLARKALGRGDLPPDLAFTVGDGLVFVETVLCCGWPQAVRRFSPKAGLAATCSRCGAAVVPQPFYAHRPVPAAVLESLVDRPLGRLGAGSAGAVVVHGGGQAVLCQEEAELCPRGVSCQEEEVKP